MAKFWKCPTLLEPDFMGHYDNLTILFDPEDLNRL